ncbi:MAG: heavy-metal-associated domain-containing protein [Chitinophagaceae bacterium]
MKKLKKLVWFVPLVLMAQVVYGQLLQVNQTVFGMDCAPCAHGVQEGLMKMNGIQAARISLNKGMAFITLNPVNSVTLSAIRKDITDNGFSPRDADVKMRGVLKNINKELALQVQNEFFWVSAQSDPSALSELKKLPSGTEVTAAGHVKDIASSKHLPIWDFSAEKIW